MSGWTSGIGGCGMIGETQINLHLGGRKRLSCLIAAVGVLLIILTAAPLIE